MRCRTLVMLGVVSVLSGVSLGGCSDGPVDCGYSAPAGSSLDEIMHMAAVVDAYELSHDQKYEAPAKTTRGRFENYPKADGVFRHANTASHQRRQ